MRHLAAYLLLQIGGNPNPTAEDIKKVLASVSIEADEERLEKLFEGIKDRTVDELIEKGSALLASVPSGKAGNVAAEEDSNSLPVPTDGEGVLVNGEEIVLGESDEEDDFGLGFFG